MAFDKHCIYSYEYLGMFTCAAPEEGFVLDSVYCNGLEEHPGDQERGGTREWSGGVRYHWVAGNNEGDDCLDADEICL